MDEIVSMHRSAVPLRERIEQDAFLNTSIYVLQFAPSSIFLNYTLQNTRCTYSTCFLPRLTSPICAFLSQRKKIFFQKTSNYLFFFSIKV